MILFFLKRIIAYEVLHGYMSFLFENDEHFNKFITLQFLACKKYIVKHIFKDSKNWSKVIHSSLQIPIKLWMNKVTSSC